MESIEKQQKITIKLYGIMENGDIKEKGNIGKEKGREYKEFMKINQGKVRM